MIAEWDRATRSMMDWLNLMTQIHAKGAARSITAMKKIIALTALALGVQFGIERAALACSHNGGSCTSGDASWMSQADADYHACQNEEFAAAQARQEAEQQRQLDNQRAADEALRNAQQHESNASGY